MTIDLFGEVSSPPAETPTAATPPCPSCKARGDDIFSGYFHAGCLRCKADGFAVGLDVWKVSKGVIGDDEFMAVAERVFGAENLQAGLAMARERFEATKAARRKALQDVRERLTAARNALAGGAGAAQATGGPK